MSKANSDRYFLFCVPAGVDDEAMKGQLGELIGYPEGIREVNWWKAAIDDQIGGAVRLQVDEEAVRLLQENRHNLIINEQPVVFVDREELPIKASCTIDDSIVGLVQQELGEDGPSWEDVVGNLTLTKYHNDDEDYDYWHVEGSFLDLKRFEAQVRGVLFKEAPFPASTIKREKCDDGVRPEDEDEYNESTESTLNATDHESDIAVLEPVPVTAGENLLATVAPSPGSANLVLPRGPPPLRIEFVVGDLTKERRVDAVVNPTNFRLEAGANELSKAISAAMGGRNYEATCKEELDAVWGSLADTFTVVTGGACLFVKYIIHVAMPQLNKMTPEKAMIEIGTCYNHCVKAAKGHHGISSISFPPLGIESGVDAEVAAGAAVCALFDATAEQEPRLSDYVKLVRFVFADNGTMVQFMETFQSHFDISVKVQDADSDVKQQEVGLSHA